MVDAEFQQIFTNPNVLKSDNAFYVLDLNRVTDDKRPGVLPLCADKHLLSNYLNSPKVRNVINIPKQAGSWDSCANIPHIIKYATIQASLAPQIKRLIESNCKLTLLVYNHVDTVLFLSEDSFIEKLGEDKQSSSFRSLGRESAGHFKHHHGISLAKVDGSGYIVQTEALVTISKFVRVWSLF